MSTEPQPAHSELGPSSAARWRRCPGSVAASRGLPDTAGIDAAQGTVFHDFAATVLATGIDPERLVGAKVAAEPFGDLPYTDEMALKMRGGLRLIEALRAEDPATRMFVETRLDLSRWLGKGQFGTSDVCLVQPTLRRLVVFDWKWGTGVPVQPEDNDQAILYALGCWAAHEADFGDPEGVEALVVIEQPRAPGGGGVWSTTMTHLLAEGGQIKRDAKATRDPNAPRIPGPIQCQFCAAAKLNLCKERAQFILKTAGAKFDALEDGYVTGEAPDLYEGRALTPEQRAQVLLHKGMIEKFLEQLHVEAIADAEAGRPTPGQKLVDGRRGARKWRDEAKAEILLRASVGVRAFKTSMISPTQTEELLGSGEYERDFAALVDQGEAKPILVPVTDKRPARRSHGDKYDLIENESLI